MEEIELTDKQESTEKKKKKKKWLLLLLLLLLLLGLGGFYAWRNYNNDSSPGILQKELSAEIGLMPGMTEDEIRELLSRTVEEGRFNASMNGNPTFTNGKVAGNVNIENIPGNRYAFTLKIEVTDVDREKYPEAAKYIGQTIMQTGLIEPNSFVTERKLDVPLPKGDYVCLATFNVYTKEDENNPSAERTEVGATAMEIVVSVKS